MYLPVKLIVASVVVVVACYFVYPITIFPMPEDEIKSIKIFKLLNNASDYKEVHSMMEEMIRTVDTNLMENMIETNKTHLVDYLKMAESGYGAAGWLFAGLHESVKELLEKHEQDPKILDTLTPKEIRALVSSLIVFDPKFMNVTVMEGGVIEMRSKQRMENLTAKMNKTVIARHADMILINAYVNELRTDFLVLQDLKYVADLSAYTGALSYVHSFLGTLPTYNVLIIFGTLLKFLRMTRMIYQLQPNNSGYYMDNIWLFKMLTGYGVPIIPLVVYLYLMAKFLFEKTIVYNIIFGYYHKLRQNTTLKNTVFGNDDLLRQNNSIWNLIFGYGEQLRQSNASWEKELKECVSFTAIILRKLSIMFCVSNLLFIFGSYIIDTYLHHTKISAELYQFTSTRVNIACIMQEELSFSQMKNVIMMTVVLIVDFYLPVVMIRLWQYYDEAKYMVINPYSAIQYDIHARTYDARLNRLRLLSAFKILMASRDLWSCSLKMTLYGLRFAVNIVSGNSWGLTLPALWDLDETKHLISWVAALWIPAVSK